MYSQIRRGATIFGVGALFLFLFFLNIESVSAEQQSLGWVKTNTCIQLKQSYANSTFQNLTAVTLPDKANIIVIKSAMNPLGQGLFNYTFCNTYQIGEYIVDGQGDVDGNRENWTYNFFASPLGIPNSFIFYLIFIAIIVLILMLGFKLENTWIMTLAGILVLIMGFFIIVNGLDQIKNQQVTWAIGLAVWGLGIYLLYLCVEEQLKLWP